MRTARSLFAIAGVVGLAGLAGCNEVDRSRPLHLEPGVYLGEKSPGLSSAQVKNLTERSNLMR